MSADKKVKARLAEILNIPENQVDQSFLIRKLVHDLQDSIIIIDNNKKKIISLPHTSSSIRIKS